MDKKTGMIEFPNLQPFDDGINSYFTQIGRTDLLNTFTYPEVYNSTVDAAKQASNKDKFLIFIE